MKNILFLMAAMMVGTTVFAQKKHLNPEQRAEKQAEKMKTTLSLNDDQYGKVKAIAKDFSSRRMKVRGDSTVSKQDKHASMKKIKDDHQQQLKSVLTDDQWKKWQAYKAEQGDKRKKNGKGKNKHGAGRQGQERS